MCLQRFLFNEAPVRGALIRLDRTWQEILSHHAYPPRLRDLLGELLAAGALLAANLKFDGTLVMQTQGSAAAEIGGGTNADHTLRATACWDGELDDDASGPLLGQGQFAAWTAQRAASPIGALWRWKATTSPHAGALRCAPNNGYPAAAGLQRIAPGMLLQRLLDNHVATATTGRRAPGGNRRRRRAAHHPGGHPAVPAVPPGIGYNA